MRFVKKYWKYMIAFAVICIVVLQLLGCAAINVYGYSVDNVYNTIKELSSDKYRGRRYGTKENMDAVNYIQEQFKEIGLKPAGENGTFLRKYYESTRTYNGTAVLELLDERGNRIKSYRYGEDFIEQAYGYSGGGEITSGFTDVKLDQDGKLRNAAPESYIAITKPEKRSAGVLKTLCMAASSANYKALITVVDNSVNLRFDNASLGNRAPYRTGYEIPALIIKQNVENELQSYMNKGYRLHLKSTFDAEIAPVADVMGMIPGKSDEYIFITAHLDNVGPQSDGTIYPGALDNASGVGAIIEIARYIKSQGKTPSKNIVFAAFNGEEGGLLGSLSYVRKPLYPLYKTTVVNLDMVGAKSHVPLTLIYNTVDESGINERIIDSSSKLRYRLKKLAEAEGIPVKEVNEESSDHVIFTNAGVPSVTLSDYDKSKIQTPDDNMSNIGKNNIDRALKTVIGYIAVAAYSNWSINGYSMVLDEIMDFMRSEYPVLIALVLIIMLIAFSYRKTAQNPKARNRRIPVLSILLVITMLGLISYFPLKYLYAPSGKQEALELVGNGLLSIFKSLILFPLYALIILPAVCAIAYVKRRTQKWTYDGSGREIDIVYYASFVWVIVSSMSIALNYNRAAYLAFTPDFARGAAGRIVLYILLGTLAYIIYRVMMFECRLSKRSYLGFLAFTVIFLMLLASFYMPVAYNRSAMEKSLSNISISEGYSMGE